MADAADWDESVDVLVIGAGAGGMAAALFASLRGLRVLLCEKSGMVGGTTSTSAGTIWVPGTSQSAAAGLPDTVEAARTYLASVIPHGSRSDVLDAVLASGPAVLDELEARTEVKFAAARAHPDYLGNRPGAAFGGRALGALPFDGRRLGADFDRVRPPRAEFMILGGMMVTKADIPDLLKPFRSLASLMHVGRMIGRYAVDRLRFRRGTHLVMGNALVARLLYSLRVHNVRVQFDAALTSLIEEGGRVDGALLQTASGPRRVRATRGVVLATGGIGWNDDLRRKMFPSGSGHRSLAPDDIRGDGIEAATSLGAQVERPPSGGGLWMPSSVLRRPDGSESVFPHIVLDRAKPGLMAVGADGRRFVNEAGSYHDFVSAMLADGPGGRRVPAFLVCDASFVRDYGLGLIHPGTRDLGRFIASGYLVEGRSPEELASRLGIDATGLVKTMESYNGFAQTGVDEEFGRGSTDLNRINGDPESEPNPCLRAVGPGPYYAVAVWPTDLASSAGLHVDRDGRVLDEDATAITGLYACGNDAASVLAGTYPGPGTTLGPAIVLAWRVANALTASGVKTEEPVNAGKDAPGLAPRPEAMRHGSRGL